MPKIIDLQGREILDSRGNPTVKAIIFLDNGVMADAAVPSGASTGTYEAYELRDNDLKRFQGKGVLKAVENINKKIKKLLLGKGIDKQREIDQLMIDLDGTENKNKLGANSILAVSLAYTRASAFSRKLPLYKYLKQISGNYVPYKTVTPLFNVVNGGLHGSGHINFQEFMLIPKMNNKFQNSLRMGAELYQLLKSKLRSEGYYYSVGDEGGFTPNLNSNEEALDMLLKVINNSNYKYKKDIYIGLDLASSTFYINNSYKYDYNKLSLSEPEFISKLIDLQNRYHLYFLEDALYEDAWKGWKELTKKIGSKTMIVGDDLLVTNKKRLQKAISEKACNSIIIKPNQIGSLTETLEVINLAKEAKFKIIISHRSGETTDDFIADLAVGIGADYVKFGAPARGERVIKYNRLLEIYREINQFI